MEETIAERVDDAVVLLTKAQAKRLTTKIKDGLNTAWELLREAHDRQAWRALGYGSFKEYVAKEFDLSEGQGYRLIDQGRVIAALEAATGDSRARESVSARTAAVLKADLPEATQEVKELVEAGLDTSVAVKAVVARRQPPSSEGGGTTGRLVPPHHQDRPPAPSGPNPERLPTVRQIANGFVVDLRNTEEGFGKKWTPEEATYVENRMAREMAEWRSTNGIPEHSKDEAPKRRQGTITRPEDRARTAAATTPTVKIERPLTSVPATRSLVREQVAPMFKVAKAK